MMPSPTPSLFTPPAKRSGVNLRPHQVKATQAVTQLLSKGVRKQLLAMATGTGKTHVAAAIAGDYGRTLFLVHRQELLEQTLDTFNLAHPREPIGTIWGRNTDHHARFNIGMVQTVYNRLDRIPTDSFDLVIADECHRYGSKTFKATLEHFQPKLRLGLSATPERYDGAPLSNLFDEVAFEYGVKDAVLDGFLVKPVGIWIRTDTSLDEVHTVAGDLNQGELSDTVNTPARNNLVVEKYQEHCQGRAAVVFCVSIEHAKHLAEAFTEAGVSADWISGDDSDRKRKIQDLRAGKTRVLCNAMLLVEGFDETSISAVLMARPTKSKVLYTQAVGRGLRLHPGKEDCLILDFADNSRRHRLVTVWDFIGRRMHRNEAGKPVDLVGKDPLSRKVGEAASVDAQDMFSELWGADLHLDSFAELVDLLEPPPPVDSFKYGKRAWHYAPPTDSQVRTLEQLGYDVAGNDFTRGQVSRMLDESPAHPNALKRLFTLGFDTLTHPWTVAQANAALKEASKRGLRPDFDRVRKLAEAGQ